MARYFDALAGEIRSKSKQTSKTINHIYVGGGTPSIAYEYFPMLKKAVWESFAVAADATISMECTP